MADYSALSSKLEDLVDAAIEADMLCHGFTGSMASGFTGYYPRRVKPDGTSIPDVIIHVDSQARVTSKPDYGDPFDYYEDSWIPSRDCWAHWASVVPALFTGWDHLPNPTAYDDAVGTLRHGATSLFQQSAFTPDEGTTAGNQSLSDIGYLNDQLTLFGGGTIQAFHRNWAANLPLVVSGQGALLHAMYFSMAGEQQLWRNAREDVMEIVDKAIAAMKQAHPSGDGGGSGWGTFFKVLATVASVAAVVVTDGAAAPAVAGANLVISNISRFVVDKPAEPKAQTELGASTPQGVCDKITDRLAEENRGISAQEGEMIRVLAQAVETAYERPESFNLLDAARAAEKAHGYTGGEVTDSDSAGELATPHLLSLNFASLKEIAHSVLPGIAGVLEAARKDAAVPDAISLFDRPAGIGQEAIWSEWSEVQWHLDAILHDSAWQLDVVGDHLWTFCLDMRETESKVASDLDHHRREIEVGSGSYTGRPVEPTRPGPGHAF